MSWSDAPTPDEAREQWHRDAAGRDTARLAEGPDDDTETDDSPWRDAESWHEFHDGPWAGERIEVGVSPDGYEHLIVHRPTMPGVGEWVPADAWPNTGRYVRTGSYGETIVMTWRQS